jgi:hypothetical protein
VLPRGCGGLDCVAQNAPPDFDFEPGADSGANTNTNTTISTGQDRHDRTTAEKELVN